MKYFEVVNGKSWVCTVCMFKNQLAPKSTAEAHLILTYHRHPDPQHPYKWAGAGTVVDCRDSDTNQHSFGFEMDEDPKQAIVHFENVPNGKVDELIRAIEDGGGEMENAYLKMVFWPLVKP